MLTMENGAVKLRKTFGVLFTLVLLNASLTTSDTVHFTNSRSRIEKSLKQSRSNSSSYQLEVPGSEPITIIESDPPFPQSSIEEKKTKDYIVPGSTHQIEPRENNTSRDESSRCFGPSCQESHNRKTVYSPELLKKFLHEYTEKIKNADEKTKQLLHQIHATVQADLRYPDKTYQKNKITENVNIQLQNEDTSRLDQPLSKKYKHPFNDNNGWVTMEAIPWSKSKISKWKANSHKINRPSNPYGFDEDDRDPSINNDRFTGPSYDRPYLDTDYNSRPYDYERPHNHHEQYDYRPNYGSMHSDDSPSRPPWSRPTDHKNCDHEEHHGYTDDNRRLTNHYQDNDGIITDGHSYDFPPYEDSNIKRPLQTAYLHTKHPSTHPSSGDGEWVLLSTTKGYQFPKKRHRSLSIKPNSVSTHKSIMLTVLPAVDGSKENMTTSHSGMLEVSPNFQTVEESRKMHEQEARHNATRLKRLKVRNVVSADTTPDSSAVIAAVGAGLVPATVAMIMPMVLGRKKRHVYNKNIYSIFTNQNVTQYPNLDYESTIQRNLN